MSFRPDVYGPTTPMGDITVAVAGTSIPLDDNWSPKYNADPVTAAAPEQYCYAAKDIMISFNPNNAGNMYLVKRGGSYLVANDILAVFPKQAGVPQLPVNLSTYFKGKLAPFKFAIDADQNGCVCYPVGIN